MGERVVFEDLTTELANVKARVECWVHTKMTVADDSISSYQRKAVDNQARVQMLDRNYQQLAAQAEALLKRRNEEQDEEAALRSELDKLKILEVTIPQQISDLQEQLDLQTEARRREEQELSKKAAEQDEKFQTVKKLECAYSARTGLRFEYSEDGGSDLRLVFTDIDPGNPAREFSFCVRVDNDSQYFVSDCIPPLPEMPAMVEELNAGSRSKSRDSFGIFVRRVREKFRLSVLNP